MFCGPKLVGTISARREPVHLIRSTSMNSWKCLFQKKVSFGLSIGCLALLIGFGATQGWAQSASTGTVFGVVTDPSGAVVVGAVVTLTDTGTGTVRTTTTNDSGRYVVANVSPANTTFQSPRRVLPERSLLPSRSRWGNPSILISPCTWARQAKWWKSSPRVCSCRP